MITTACALAAAAGCFFPGSSAERELRLDAVTLPRGFSIAVYADNVPGARSMAL